LCVFLALLALSLPRLEVRLEATLDESSGLDFLDFLLPRWDCFFTSFELRTEVFPIWINSSK